MSQCNILSTNVGIGDGQNVQHKSRLNVQGSHCHRDKMLHWTFWLGQNVTVDVVNLDVLSRHHISSLQKDRSWKKSENVIFTECYPFLYQGFPIFLGWGDILWGFKIFSTQTALFCKDDILFCFLPLWATCRGAPTTTLRALNTFSETLYEKCSYNCVQTWYCTVHFVCTGYCLLQKLNLTWTNYRCDYWENDAF